MGKDKTDWKAENRWRTGQINSKERAAMERYGLNASDYGWDKSDNPGRHSGGDYDDMREDFLRAASNDYDTRRGMEAMAMSGKAKAEKIAKGGFKNTGDVMNANNMQRKMHERMGNGGDFSSRSDFAGVSYNAVERDREKQTEGYNKDYALGADLAALREEMDERGDQKSENVLPAQLSETTSAAESQSNEYELNLGGTGTDIFGGGSPQEQEQAQEFSDNAKDQVKKGLQLSNVESRGPRSGIRPGAGF